MRRRTWWMAAGTFLTLFLIPILYLAVERRGHRPDKVEA